MVFFAMKQQETVIATQKQIANLETLKVMSDPLRIQLIEVIREQNTRGELANVSPVSREKEYFPSGQRSAAAH